jgi:hypothetical protein
MEDLLRAPIDKSSLSNLFATLEFTRHAEKFGLASEPAVINDTEQISFDTLGETATSAREVTADTFVACESPAFVDFDPVSKLFYREENGEALFTRSTKALIEKLAEKKLVIPAEVIDASNAEANYYPESAF